MWPFSLFPDCQWQARTSQMATKTQHCCSFRSQNYATASVQVFFSVCQRRGSISLQTTLLGRHPRLSFAYWTKQYSEECKCFIKVAVHQLFNGLKEITSFHSLPVVRDDERCSLSTPPCFSAAPPDAVHIAKTDTRTGTVLFAFSAPRQPVVWITLAVPADSFKFPKLKELLLSSSYAVLPQ